MIKKLSLKFVLVFLVLVVSVFITSSCYALTINEEVLSAPVSAEDFLSYALSNENVINQHNNTFGSFMGETDINKWHFDVIAYNAGNSIYYLLSGYPSTLDIGYYYPGTNAYLHALNSNKGTNAYIVFYAFQYTNGSFVFKDAMGTNYVGIDFMANTISLYDATNVVIKSAQTGGSVVYEPSRLSVDVTHEFQSDTSAKVNFVVNNAPEGAVLQYSLTGVEINADLTAPIKLRNPVTYYPGISNLQVKENTKVYWALYDTDGNCLLTDVYQVPEYDAVIENSDKEIEYSVTYNEDYSKATLSVNVVNGEFSDKLYYTENGLFTNDYPGKQLFPASRTLEIDHNCNMNIVLYDSFDNLIIAKYVTINQIGSIPEENFKVNVVTEKKAVLLYPRLYNILQSRFYDIEYEVNLDHFSSSDDVTLYQDGVKVGDVKELTGTYTCGSDSELRFYQSVGTSEITITFRVVNAETGTTCITRTVSFKIGLNDESTGVTGSTTNGNSDDSFIISDGYSSGGSGYSKVSWKDISNLINTNSDFWQIIKNILACLPIWITGPIFFFISAVVTICLTRMVLSIVGHLVG